MIKKTVCLVISVLLLLTTLLFGCEAVKEEEPQKPIPEEYREVIGDNMFATGFNLMGQYPDITGRDIWRKFDYKSTAKPTDKPLWFMAQWSNQNNFAEAEETHEGDTYIYTDESKQVKVDPKKGSLSLEINTEFEYDHPRESGERWMHLLIEQDFVQKTRIDNAEKIMAEIKFSIDKADNKMGTAYNKNIHTGHFLWYFTLQNQPKSGTEAEVGKTGDFLWFGVPLFDYRYGTIGESAVVDGGSAGTTGKLIYSMSNGWYLPTPIEIGEKYDVSVDIYPYLQGALQKAQKLGLMQNVKFENLEFNYMNIGWEVPGTFNVGSTIDKMSVKVYDKKVV